MPKQDAQPRRQGAKAKPLAAGHSIADWARKKTAAAYRHLPKPQRDVISREMYERLAVLCYHGEGTFHHSMSGEEATPLIANLLLCLALEFGITVEFMRLVRDQFGGEIGWRTNQARAEKGLPRKLKPAAIALRLRDPNVIARLPSDAEATFAEIADLLGPIIGGVVSATAYKKARQLVRSGVKKS